ncbi:renal cancer differentiation gene 1 protein [Lethenteron reissneri]|uniref:renal cancer differentiation gene 1 protein n=1 Tax=Lethenteron reissneri TaxID=7753 RepID=UPI002AB61BC9|nr:renal cancer differentiation gene 1 protein [Lethenteron reissneri]XP_061408100.1 renal cancer differentiation gene 1 protein [Lethenteron reissneri]
MSGDLTVQDRGDAASTQSPGEEPSDAVELREELHLYVERATEKLVELLSLTEAAAQGVQSLSEQCSQNARFIRAWVLFIRSGRGIQVPNPMGLEEEMEEEGDPAQ